jgi:hypothetical protein
MWISLDTEVLLEIHWRLESYEDRELPGEPG